MSNKRELVGKVYLYTRLDTYAPSIIRLFIVTVTTILVSTELESTVEEEAYSVELSKRPTSIRSNYERIYIYTLFVVVLVAYLRTDSPVFAQIVTYLRKNLERGFVCAVGPVTPKTNFATNINLCACSKSYKSCCQSKQKFLHHKKFLIKHSPFGL